MMMLVAIVITPLVAINILGGWDNVSGNLLTQGGAGFLNLFNDAAGKPMTFIEIISQLAWALGYFGMPHILVRFMAIKSKDMIKKSRIIATSWVLISLGAACLVGLVGRALLPELLARARARPCLCRWSSSSSPPLSPAFCFAASWRPSCPPPIPSCW